MTDEEGETEVRNLHLRRLRKNIQRKVNKELDFEIAQLEDATVTVESDNELNLKGFDDENSASNSDECVVDQWVDFNVLDSDDYGNLIESLSDDKSTSTKIEAVHNLTNCHVVDVNSKHWSKLSQNLQHCVTHVNDKLYKGTLRLHYKIISSRNSSCEGIEICCRA